MYLQGVDSVYNLKWTDTLSYGDVYHQNEVEQSTYNFEHSDVDFLLVAFGMPISAPSPTRSSSKSASRAALPANPTPASAA